MNLITIVFSYLAGRRLNTALNALLLASGIAIIVVLILFSAQFQRNLETNAQGINLVVGAKGSPVQLILSSVYHMDVPTGNMPLREALMLKQQRAVKKAIPLAMGDSYEEIRIIGTTPDYLEHYSANIGQGRIWDEEMEAVVGAEAAKLKNLIIGSELISTHGIDVGGDAHGDTPIIVTGILEPTGTVLDRLILTNVETIWEVHGQARLSVHHCGQGS